MAPIFFLSDFGTRDAYAGVVEAVIAGIAPRTRVIHLTHGVPPQDVRHGGFQLFAAAPYLPVGSVVLAVVDPGVGSSRRAVVIEGERHVWVAPDNGLLEAALTVDPAKRAFEIDSRRFRVTSATFHGRDVFGPAAAHLASGASIETLGSETPVSTLVRLGVLPSRGPNGELWTFDHYGNAITTIRAPGERPAAVRVRGREIRFATHYAEVERGEALALVGSSGLVEISVRDGSARAALGLQEGDAITLV